MKDDWEIELFGTDLISFFAAGQMLHIAVKPNQGRFNPDWLDLPNFSFLPSLVDPELTGAMLAIDKSLGLRATFH